MPLNLGSVLSSTVVVSLAIAALLFVPQALYPFEPIKMLGIELALVLGSIIVLLQWQRSLVVANRQALKQYCNRRGLFAVTALLVVLLSSLLTFLFSIDSWSSWNAPPSRAISFKAQLVLAVLSCISLWAFLFDKKALSRVIEFLAVIAVIVVGYAIMQKLNVDPFVWQGNVQNRPISTFGNPNYMASFLVMSVPLFLLMGVHYRKRLFILAAAISLLGIFLSGSRAALLALALIAFCSLVVFFTRWHKARLTLLLLCLLLGSTTLIVKLNTGQTWLESKVSQIDRQSGTATVRLKVWQGHTEALLNPSETITSNQWIRASLGYGQGTTYVISGIFYDPELRALEAQHSFADHAHNRLLNAALERGIIGLLSSYAVGLWIVFWLAKFYWGRLNVGRVLSSFLVVSLAAPASILWLDDGSLRLLFPVISLIPIVGLFVYGLVRGRDKVKERDWVGVAIMASGLLYWIDQTFSVPSIASEALFWVLIAAGVTRIDAQKMDSLSLNRNPTFSLIVTIPTCISIALIALLGTYVVQVMPDQLAYVVTALLVIIIALQLSFNKLEWLKKVTFCVLAGGLVLFIGTLLHAEVLRKSVYQAQDTCLIDARAILNHSENPHDWSALSRCAYQKYLSSHSPLVNKATVQSPANELPTVRELLQEQHVLGKTELAILTLQGQRNAADIQSNNGDHFINLVKLGGFFESPNTEQQQALRKASELRPFDYQVLNERMSAELKAGELDAALSLAEQTLDYYPMDESVAIKLAKIRHLKGDMNGAINGLNEFMQKGSELSNSNIDRSRVKSELAILYADAGDYSKAFFLSLEILKQTPNSVAALKNVVVLAIAAGYSKRARKWCDNSRHLYIKAEDGISRELLKLCRENYN